MRAANPACMALNGCGGIDHVELVAIFENGDVFARHDRNHREDGSFRFPAFRAAAGVVVGDVTLDADFDRPVLDLQTRVPPVKLPEPFLTPLSTDGWI